jgi:predicted nucleic acid-binding protein
MARFLVDTNVALRMMAPLTPEHAACRSASQALLAAGHELVLAPQVIYEFWVVSTRPTASRGGFGWSPAQAAAAVERLLKACTLCAEHHRVFELWRALVTAHAVTGKRAHDARLAAFKQAHAIPYFVTLNAADFASLTDGVLSPDQAAAQA